jgi:hypothetical protein
MKTKQEILDTIKKLEEKYSSNRVEYVGTNRFILSEYINKTDEDYYLSSTRLFDESCNEIHLSNLYNGISMFRCGVAVAINYSEIKLADGRFSHNGKVGLIDINGIELLPCEYEEIEVQSDGGVLLTKDNSVIRTNVDKILSAAK